MITSASIARLPAKAAYVAAWKRLKDMPLDGVVVLHRHDSSIPVHQARAQFRRALDQRINARAGDNKRNEPIDVELVRDARKLDDILQRRIRVYQFATKVVRERFSHLLSSHND